MSDPAAILARLAEPIEQIVRAAADLSRTAAIARERAEQDDPLAGCPGLMTVTDVARVLRLRGTPESVRQTIARWRREGLIATVNNGTEVLVSREQLRQFIARRSEGSVWSDPRASIAG